MKKLVTSLLAIILFLNVTCSQSTYYMPEEISNAYQSKTRAITGLPGENYFQNYVKYKIDAELNPETKLLSGSEIVNYENNSPDTLENLVFNLYADIYKKGNIRDWSIGSVDLHDGVQIKSLNIDGKDISITSDSVSIYNTAMIITLVKKLPPKSKMQINISWEYTVPSEVNIRQGTYNQTSFFIGYWYPQMAVYEDIFGWNIDVYSGQTEFYHEYADYDVSITAPDEYFVLASGLLQNEEDVLSKDILKKYNSAKKSEQVVNVVTKEDRINNDVTKGSDSKIWKFKAENLPDFAFAMSNKYLWDATSLQIGNEKVLVNAVYAEENIAFNQVADISKKVLKMLSDSVIGVNYPYPQMTAFMGHYGMEYPGMINDGDGDYASTVYVTAHEITHTYFPFYVATNETKYAWMDEGLVTFLPKPIENKMIEDNNSYIKMVKTYNNYCGKQMDLPLITPSDQISGLAYRFHAYSKPAVAYYVLKQTLGEDVFEKCIVEFINRWNGKHPTGYDLFYTFENVSGQDLNWFFKPWFFEMGYPDLYIKNTSKIDENTTLVEVANYGTYPVPIKLTITYNDNSEEIVELNASVWKENTESYKLEIENTKKITKIILGDINIPDKTLENNILEF